MHPKHKKTKLYIQDSICYKCTLQQPVNDLYALIIVVTNNNNIPIMPPTTKYIGTTDDTTNTSTNNKF